jgi:RimJ/RimL family protein N-acetyltransferase
VELRAYTDADLALTVALETDPEVMRELGGPRPRTVLDTVHRRRLGDPWWFTIVDGPDRTPAGNIGIWASDLEGRAIHETGWMILPAHQGRGLASAALAELLHRARAEPAFSELHAFPGVTNGPSNALCEKFGFSAREEREFEFSGRPLRCRHWVLSV